MVYSLSLLSFKIKKKTTLRKLMAAYCNKKGLDLQAVRFWYVLIIFSNHHLFSTFVFLLSFEGNRLRPDDSVLTIPDLEDGDTIEVFQEQQGGEGATSDVQL